MSEPFATDLLDALYTFVFILFGLGGLAGLIVWAFQPTRNDAWWRDIDSALEREAGRKAMDDSGEYTFNAENMP